MAGIGPSARTGSPDEFIQLRNLVNELIADRSARIERENALTVELADLRNRIPAPPQVVVAAPANPAPVSVRPPAPARFSQPAKDQTTAEWLFILEMYFAAVRLEDLHQRIGFTATLLEGLAAAWWAIRHEDIIQGRLPDFTSWDEFKYAMVQYFHPAGTEQAARNALRELRQLGRVQSYVRVFQRTVAQIPRMDQGSVVDAFVHGLKEDVRAFVRTRRPDSLIEAVEAAETFEASTLEGRRFTPEPRRYQERRPHHEGRPEPMQLGVLEEGENEDGSDADRSDEATAELNAVAPYSKF